MEGVVVKVTGSWHEIRLADNSILPSRMAGKLRMEDIKTTNPVGVGDRVTVQYDAGETTKGLITEILPRANYIVRQSPRKKHDLHLLAANVDQAILVTTIVSPMLKIGFIDRFLLMTEPHNIPVVIVVNKNDLFGEEEDEIFGGLKILYEDIGYQVISCSGITGEGLEELKSILQNKTSLVAGQSGVGKSTLINSIEPGLSLKTDEISDYSGKGQHTTTFAEMHPLTFGGNIIDTPGIKMLSYNNLEPLDVAHNFREFFVISKNCRFLNCLHKEEPGCAVKAAIEAGRVSSLRYDHYLQIMSEIEDQNYWERHKDL
ncbi:MAG: ribosome small subunit-dependent GTPase A [Saprospiraceae bacterium]|uniref:Small ribosomal subunit biogenesis GTPase RsgA n=1 Tax=Candidatus Opimibacter skivensis TaxID=2982028 RepID=A0A9D7SVM8_9BACT|nr:ribosome small subunit-dependent GTPase A [Candidatus Opimibacter skivensis]